MPKPTQDERIVIRLEPRLMEITRALVVERDTGAISEYIRGLIVADAVKQGKSLAGVAIPGWLTDTLVELRLVHADSQTHPRSSGTSPTEEKEQRDRPHESSARGEGKNQPSKKNKHHKEGSG
jgi:hypothetical protein